MVNNRELELLASKKPKSKYSKNDESLNTSIVCDDEEIFNLINVKILTKDGVCSIETNKVRINLRDI